MPLNPQPSKQIFNNPPSHKNSFINNNNNNHSIYSSDFSRNYYSPSVESIRNMDIMNDTPAERGYQFPSPSAPSVGSYSSNYGTPATATVAGYSSYAQCYSSALSESLAETPGISITPLEYDNNMAATAASYYGGKSHSAGATAGHNCKLEVSEGAVDPRLLFALPRRVVVDYLRPKHKHRFAICCCCFA